MVSIQAKMEALENKGCLRGTIPAKEAMKYIEPTTSLEQCVSGASYVQVRYLHSSLSMVFAELFYLFLLYVLR